MKISLLTNNVLCERCIWVKIVINFFCFNKNQLDEKIKIKSMHYQDKFQKNSKKLSIFFGCNLFRVSLLRVCYARIDLPGTFIQVQWPHIYATKRNEYIDHCFPMWDQILLLDSVIENYDVCFYRIKLK